MKRGARLGALLSFWAASASAAGGAGFDFLSEPPGARSPALGGTAVAAADDAESSLFNPAALAELTQAEASFGYDSVMEGMTRASLVYAHPFSGGGLGLSVRTLGSGEIPTYDSSDGRVGTHEAKDLAYSAGYGRKAGRLRWGVNLKQAGETLAGRSARVTAADLGALYRPASWPVAFSAALRNAGGKASFGGRETELPRSLDLGLNASLLSRAVLLTAESRQGDGVRSFAAGAETWLYNVMALRAGWRSDGVGDGLSLGMGFKLRDLRVDYAFSGNGDGFSPTHRMGVSLRFGGPGERAYQEGLALLQRGRPAEAVLKFQESLDADPGRVRAINALREAVRKLNEEMREDVPAGGNP